MDSTVLEQKQYWQKTIIILAGIIINFLCAVVIFFLLFLLFRKRIIPVIDLVQEESPAAFADLRTNDHIAQYNGTPITSIGQIITTITQSPGKTLYLTLKRANETVEKTVTIAPHPYLADTIGYLGITFKEEKKPFNAIALMSRGFHATLALLTDSFYTTLSFFTGKQNREKRDALLLFTVENGITESALGLYLFVAASFNMQIAFFNILPLPLLDGGKFLQFTLEALSGRHISPFISMLIGLILTISIIRLVNRNKRD